MSMKKCPVCGVSVKIENLERHVKGQHPREDVDLRGRLTELESGQLRRMKVSGRPKFKASRLWPLALTAIIVVVILVVTLIRPTTGISIGQTAPEIELSNTDGGTTRLSDLRGRPVVLEFMDVDCDFCVAEADVLGLVYQHRASVANFFSVDLNFKGEPDDAARINQFRQTHGTPWPYAVDTDGSYAKTYAVDATPKTFILDSNGVVNQIFSGHVNGGNATYEAAIDRLL